MIELLAQLVAPPLQNSPIRLPGPESGQRPSMRTPPTPVDIENPISAPQPDGQPLQPGEGNIKEQPTGLEQDHSNTKLQVTGLTIYKPQELEAILSQCTHKLSPAEQLRQCAAALSARLSADGYINSKVYIQDKVKPFQLEVVEGRIIELHINSNDDHVEKQIRALLASMQGSILHLPTVERQLQKLRQLPGTSNVRGNLTRLGSDPAQAVLTVNIQSADQPWRGELSIRNEGSNGSGEGRSTATVLKADLITRGDTLLIYSELNLDKSPSLGGFINSISYTLPLASQLSFTSSFGYSKRKLIELPVPANAISTNQWQGLAQVDWAFEDSLAQRWSLFAGVSGNRTNTFVNGKALPELVPESVRTPQNGYLRMGLNGNGVNGPFSWSGSLYVLQGLALMTPEQQRRELALAGISPGAATALAGFISFDLTLTPRIDISLQGAGQWAFRPLTNSMQFSVGADSGIRGLPGQLISGDSGWLGSAELNWTLWKNRRNALQLVPFLGMGGVQTTIQGLTFSDSVGAGGILARWLHGNHWAGELGWIKQFQADDNVGTWTDWALSKGIYAQVKYRF